MMFLLIINVIDNPLQIFRAESDDSVAALPFKRLWFNLKRPVKYYQSSARVLKNAAICPSGNRNARHRPRDTPGQAGRCRNSVRPDVCDRKSINLNGEKTLIASPTKQPTSFLNLEKQGWRLTLPKTS